VEPIKYTALNLLTREGAVACIFEPGLTPDQYDSLFNVVPRAETKAELESYLRRFAHKWQLTVTICGELHGAAILLGIRE
jgi:hypothetical protein